jgi:DNA-binding transcriptional MerR regulator
MAFLPEIYRGEKFIGTSELAKAVETLLRALGAKQERGTVSEIPDERTIRFYQSEGLIDPPISKAGSASVFTFKHLLQLVAIKLLQAQDVPIKKLRFVIAGKSEPELEYLIESSRQSLTNDATTFLLSLRNRITKEPPRGIESHRHRETDEGFQTRALESRFRMHSMHIEEKDDEAPKVHDGFIALTREGRSPLDRHQISKGIELRTRQDRIGEISAEEYVEIMKKIGEIIKRFLGKDP